MYFIIRGRIVTYGGPERCIDCGYTVITQETGAKEKCMADKREQRTRLQLLKALNSALTDVLERVITQSAHDQKNALLGLNMVITHYYKELAQIGEAYLYLAAGTERIATATITPSSKHAPEAGLALGVDPNETLITTPGDEVIGILAQSILEYAGANYALYQQKPQLRFELNDEETVGDGGDLRKKLLAELKKHRSGE